MGPQLDSCGRFGYAGRHDNAMELQWGRNLTVAEGAPSLASGAGLPTLQWGRNLTVAEGLAGPRGPALILSLQWGRNLTVAEGAAWAGM